MENATEALYIAAGTLLGVMIISLVVFFFRRVGSLQEQQDRIMTADQLAEWNNVYLAYNKKIMYGTDLISVLNKAQSNNEKYVNGKGFLTGYKYTNSYLINIEFTLKSPLQDSITVYYFDEDNTKKEVAYTTGDKPDGGKKLFDVFLIGILFNCFIRIRGLGEKVVIYCFLISSMTDTFAYLGGSLLGKHKLISHISPNKTVEGSITGSIMGTIIGSIYYYLVIGNIEIYVIIVLSLGLTILSQMGDLFKRYYKIKDYSNIIPGHGGVLDRLDSSLFVILGFLLYFVIR